MTWIFNDSNIYDIKMTGKGEPIEEEPVLGDKRHSCYLLRKEEKIGSIFNISQVGVAVAVTGLLKFVNYGVCFN